MCRCFFPLCQYPIASRRAGSLWLSRPWGAAESVGRAASSRLPWGCTQVASPAVLRAEKPPLHGWSLVCSGLPADCARGRDQAPAGPYLLRRTRTAAGALRREDTQPRGPPWGCRGVPRSSGVGALYALREELPTLPGPWGWSRGADRAGEGAGGSGHRLPHGSPRRCPGTAGTAPLRHRHRLPLPVPLPLPVGARQSHCRYRADRETGGIPRLVRSRGEPGVPLWSLSGPGVEPRCPGAGAVPSPDGRAESAVPPAPLPLSPTERSLGSVLPPPAPRGTPERGCGDGQVPPAGSADAGGERGAGSGCSPEQALRLRFRRGWSCRAGPGAVAASRVPSVPRLPVRARSRRLRGVGQLRTPVRSWEGQPGAAPSCRGCPRVLGVSPVPRSRLRSAGRRGWQAARAQPGAGRWRQRAGRCVPGAAVPGTGSAADMSLAGIR